MNVSIEPAQKQDLPDILTLYAQPELDDGAMLDLAASEALFDKFATYPNYRLYVARTDEGVKGVFALLIMDNLGHLGAPSAVVEGVAIAPSSQGQGIGRRMMDWARVYARDKGCYKLCLSSNLKRERAHAFYDQLGFERHGYSFLTRLDQKEEVA